MLDTANPIEHVPARHWESWRDRHAGATIIDVREPHEWLLGTLPGSETIQLAALPRHLDGLDRSTPVLFVCATGARSTTAAAWAMSMGFSTSASLAGGLVALGMA